ncbi:MAG TPA: hypothetical protein DCS66_04930 [Flavobacteriaceae bacterium]|nr:hypothetical protein [Flavobacteriaceae bacterium]|tara:strand:+ start:141 stop:335 length:195 start_codon:yes stop_codon:yes gene_type:complete
MIKFCEFILKEENKKTYDPILKERIKLNHYQEKEVFAGHFNPAFESVWIIAKEYFTNSNECNKI